MIDSNVGQHTLSECEDKETRADKTYWEKRVKEEGTERSIFCATPQTKVEKFSKRHDFLIRKFVKDKDVLEIGCGYGRMIGSFLECRSYVGVDFVTQLIRQANKLKVDRSRFQFRVEDVRNLPFEQKSFDSIVGIAVITSMEKDFHDVVRKLKGLLRPGGIILWLEEEWTRIDYV